MKDIFLHGALGKKFGTHFRLDVRSVGEAVRALEANFKGEFYKYIKDGTYHIQRNLSDYGIVDKQQLIMNLGSSEIHIVPVIQGAKGKGKGILTVFLGVALIGAAIAFAPAMAGAGGLFGANMGATAFTAFGSAVSWGQVAMYGASLAISGASTLLSSQQQVDSGSYASREKADERPSYLFNGATNNTEQGGPVPLVYGKMRVGSVVLSGGLTSEKLAT